MERKINKEPIHFFLSFTQQILLDASSRGLGVHQTHPFCFPPETFPGSPESGGHVYGTELWPVGYEWMWCVPCPAWPITTPVQATCSCSSLTCQPETDDLMKGSKALENVGATEWKKSGLLNVCMDQSPPSPSNKYPKLKHWDFGVFCYSG